MSAPNASNAFRAAFANLLERASLLSAQGEESKVSFALRRNFDPATEEKDNDDGLPLRDFALKFVYDDNYTSILLRVNTVPGVNHDEFLDLYRKMLQNEPLWSTEDDDRLHGQEMSHYICISRGFFLLPNSSQFVPVDAQCDYIEGLISILNELSVEKNVLELFTDELNKQLTFADS